MIQAGLIGCGYIANKHIATIAKFAELKLAAVSDIEWEKMNEAAATYKRLIKKDAAIDFYRNYEEMLVDSNIDIVIIATNSSLHAEIAKKAIENGKHAIVEKPLALSLEEADEIISLSKERDVKVLVCHQLRYRPLLEEVKSIVEAGWLGKLYFGAISLRLHRSSEYYDSSRWKGTWQMDGGMLLNQGIHLVDLLIWIMGDIKSVYGEIATKIDNKETEDIATGIVSFKNGAKGIIEANTITKPENLGYYLSIFGEKGTICIEGKGLNEIEQCYVHNRPDAREHLEKRKEKTDEHFRMYKDFIRGLINHEPHLMNAQEGKKAVEAIFALYKSDRKRMPVHLPVKKFRTTDML